MQTRIQKWGNSQGLRLPKSLLEESGFRVGDTVEITVRDGVIVLSPPRRVRGRYRLEDLVARIPKEHPGAEVEWGEPVGREAW
jgi:antitoxin MazE